MQAHEICWVSEIAGSSEHVSSFSPFVFKLQSYVVKYTSMNDPRHSSFTKFTFVAEVEAGSVGEVVSRSTRFKVVVMVFCVFRSVSLASGAIV